MVPILTVEKESFKNLIFGHGFKPPCQETTLNHLKDRKKANVK